MKKILAIALVLLLVAALAIPAFAAGSPDKPGPEPDGNVPGGNVPSGNNSDAKTSPQTGYNTLVWGITAVAMVICAGYCFSKSGKKDAC